MERKHVFIICSEKIYGSNLASSSRILNYAKALAESGIEVYFSSKTHHVIKAGDIKNVQDGIYFIDNYHSGKGFKRFITRNSYISSLIYLFLLAGFIRRTKVRSTVLLYPSTDYTMEPTSLLVLKYFYKIPLFCEINELRCAGVPGTRISGNPRKLLNHLQSRFRYFLHRRNEPITRHFDGLIVISTNLEDYYRRFNRNTIKVPILCDSKLYAATNVSFKFGQSFRIGFSGQINIRKEGLDTFFTALGLVKESYSEIQFDLYGGMDFRDKSKLDSIISNYGLEHIISYKGMVPQETVAQVLNSYHLLVIPRKNNLQTKYGFSTKLSDYLLTGVPILTSNLSDVLLYMTDGQNAYVINEVTPESFKAKLLEIITNYEQNYDSLKVNAYKTLTENFDYRNYSHVLSGFLFS